MATYLNRRTGVFSGLAAVLAIAALALVILVLIGWLLLGDEAALESGSAQPAPSAEVSGTPGAVVEPARADFPGTFFTLPSKDVWELWRGVRESAYVRNNRAYETVIRNARFDYLASDDNVNAFAGWLEEQQVRIPIMVLEGGLVRFIRLASLAVALDGAGVTQNALPRLVEEMMAGRFGSVSESRARELYERAGLTAVTNSPQREAVMTVAGGIEAGAIFAALAHEAGHLAFGHGHRVVEVNDEITRNMEREADSFSFSVITASPDSLPMMMGYLVEHGVLALRERACHAPVGNHPYSQERIANLMRSNPRFDALIRAHPDLTRAFGLPAPENHE